MNGIPCAIVRGGTSKGVFLLEEHLPADPGERDRLLLALMGSPDPRQIDGLGGADPLTSKVAIVSRSTREGIDVEYESLEVGIGEAQVNHGLMCGNLIAGVGYFAIAEGLVAAQSPQTTIRIFCRSNHKVIAARIPLAVPGEAGTGRSETPPVSLHFERPGGAITGQLLPAGEPVSLLALAAGRQIAVSIVDAGTLYAFVPAGALGLSGDESVAALDTDAGLRATIEALREQAAERINRRHASSLAAIAPRLVKVAIVGAAPPERRDIDLVARIIN
ncbi:MAG TPA: PrpF domain-containing protein, partial [Azonexus sp.]|nr:PrpF domain-containing protein [Azonexus sp.]